MTLILKQFRKDAKVPVITNNIRHPNQLPLMAETLGVDLNQAMKTDRIANFQRHFAAYRCSECAEKSACDAWLQTHSDGIAEAPDYCANKALLEGLRT